MYISDSLTGTFLILTVCYDFTWSGGHDTLVGLPAPNIAGFLAE